MIKQAEKPITYTSKDRIFYSQNNDIYGTTLICFGGIHGNEPAGVYGLQKVISDIIVNDLKFKERNRNGNKFERRKERHRWKKRKQSYQGVAKYGRIA